MIDYLASIVRPLLEDPNEFSITESTDQMGVLLSIHISARDMGIIIGKQGETAKSIRHLMRLYGSKHSARVAVKIVEPPGGKFFGTEVPTRLTHQNGSN